MNFCRRLLWLVLTIINWAIYIPTFVMIYVLEIVAIVLLPVVWVFCGRTVTQKIYDGIFKHSNEKLWFVEPWDYRSNDMTFVSWIPIHGKYIQKYIDLLLPKMIV